MTGLCVKWLEHLNKVSFKIISLIIILLTNYIIVITIKKIILFEVIVYEKNKLAYRPYLLHGHSIARVRLKFYPGRVVFYIMKVLTFL